MGLSQAFALWSASVEHLGAILITILIGTISIVGATLVFDDVLARIRKKRQVPQAWRSQYATEARVRALLRSLIPDVRDERQWRTYLGFLRDAIGGHDIAETVELGGLDLRRLKAAHQVASCVVMKAHRLENLHYGTPFWIEELASLTREAAHYQKVERALYRELSEILEPAEARRTDERLELEQETLEQRQATMTFGA